MDINTEFAGLAAEALASYAAEVRTAFDALVALDAPTAEQVAEAEGLADHLDAIFAEQAARETVAQDTADRAAALRTRFSETEAEDEEDAEDEDAEDEETEAATTEPVAASTAPVVKGEVVKSTVAALAKKTKRPEKPVLTRKPVSITAAADVPEFSTGSKMEDMVEVGKALVNRMRGFGVPSGDGTTENLQHYGVASFRLDFPAEFTIDRHSDDMEVLAAAAAEARLPGGSLVAAGGWCAPSEVIYDLCPGGTLDGILSLPEVNAARGGIKYTQGPDFSALYAAGFCQTEAQAIAGTAKTCYTVECPPFVEVRLDACGICIKVPILTNAAYPELIASILSEALVAFAHMMNAKNIDAIADALGAPLVFAGLGAVSTDTLEALLIAGANIRQKNRLGLTASLEVVVPYWAKDVLLSDVARRNGGGYGVATDADVSAIFAAANMSVQYVYDWNELPADSIAWPAEIPVLIYAAGTFVHLTTDVINLNAVYDAASLAVNTYTGLFFEQGSAVAQMCNSGAAITIPVCNAGRTGAADLVCAVTP